MGEKQNNFHIVHLGVSGFPHGFGAMQRLILLFKGLAYSGVDVFIINRKGSFFIDEFGPLSLTGIYDGLPYQYLSDTPYKHPKFWNRNFQKIKAFIREYKLLRKRKKEGKLSAAILYLLGEFHYILYYYLISRIIGFPIILNFVELNSSFGKRNIRTRLNDFLFESISPKLADGFLPISDYLADHIRFHDDQASILKIPVITDFDQFPISNSMNERGRYLLYCGAASYTELIEFVLKAYDMADIGDMPLHFILGGTEKELTAAKGIIEQCSKSSNCLFTGNLPHDQVPDYLISATGLLIPLRPTIQDKARFPHKVGEYLASGTPLVTTNYGEIKNYLKDGESAYIASTYDINDYSSKIEELVTDTERAKKIGLAGRKKAEEEFDYKHHGQKLVQFIEKVINLRSTV